MPYETPRGELLNEAAELIHGDRNKTYGSPVENFENTAALWTIQLRNKLKPGEEITAPEVALLMIHLKMARTINQPKRDNFLDVAGYAACGWEAAEATQRSREVQLPLFDTPQKISQFIPAYSEGRSDGAILISEDLADGDASRYLMINKSVAVARPVNDAPCDCNDCLDTTE